MVIRAGKSGVFFVNRTISWLPTALTPATSLRYRAPGEFIAGSSTRLKARTYCAAVSGAPVLKRKPFRIVNV